MAEAKLRERPLSPHLQLYRWTWTMAMSIMHRITGGALYIGTILLAFWLLSMASGPAAYERATWFFGSIIGRLILFVSIYTLIEHMVGGIRHLIWDFGYGMEPGTQMNMARATPIAAAILTLLIWIVAVIARRGTRPPSLTPGFEKNAEETTHDRQQARHPRSPALVVRASAGPVL